ncbi:MAG: hypothetical protein QN178_10250 [Armatimonadota bacterium]|nr:hypothetical protein [Armatimonadota bacterium]
MPVFTIVVRLVHITTAALWAGAAVAYAGFASPAARAMGPDGGKFTQRLVAAGFPTFMNWMSWTATLSGLLLYWRVSGGAQPAWIASMPGLVFTLGSIAGIAAFLTGALVNSPAAARLGAVGREVQASGGPPMPGQTAEMQALHERLRKGGHWGTSLLVVALILMSAARYLR